MTSRVDVADECQYKYRNPNHRGDPKYCLACEAVYCDQCYEAQQVHIVQQKRNNTHEMTDLTVARYVLGLFNNFVPRIEDRQKQHEDAFPSKWFGIEIESSVKSSLHVFGALGTLMKDSPLPPFQHYPSLISFVGDTGAGKSTLINGITKLPVFTKPRESTRTLPHPEAATTLSPVMGASTDQGVPTSGDVHLFCDPITRGSKYPMYYADCEGMNGGDDTPVAEKCLRKKALDKMREFYVETRREITQPSITRGWAVKELYPSILFPFSDVICYVTQNAKNFEKHLEKLLLWANKAMDKSTNQPLLPHAIIIINVFKPEPSEEHDGFQDWWDPTKVTNELLRVRKDLVNNASSKIGRLAGLWRTHRGREIRTLEQLIKCYYSDFKVICIPDLRNNKLSLTLTQYQALREILTGYSKESRKSRQKLGFLMSGETFQRYLNMAFDHFAKSYRKPFNFLSAALLRNPVSQTLKDHICRLAVHYMKVSPHKTGNHIFRDLGTWVGSCIFLDSHRRELPSNEVADAMLRQYQHFCTSGQLEFYDKQWPCEALDKYNDRCVNLKSTHDSKNHQNSSGKMFYVKDVKYKLDFKSSFETDEDRKKANDCFLEVILAALTKCILDHEQRIKSLESSDIHIDIRASAAETHKSTIMGFRNKRIMTFFVSHKSCFCCLTSIPVHKLPCGHVICHQCLEDYSRKEDHIHYLVLRACPLCGRSPKYSLRYEIKPPTAGLRILCLDGGGIRSIIQLYILQSLVQEIGLDIPVHQYFDLIVGTSGGGIVAAGLGIKEFNIDQAITVFETLANKAFVKRTGCDIPLIGNFLVAQHHGLYRTSPLEAALKDVFGRKSIFGADIEKDERIIRNLKVAVTMVSDRHSYVVGNYNRPPREISFTMIDIEIARASTSITDRQRRESQDTNHLSIQETGGRRGSRYEEMRPLLSRDTTTEPVVYDSISPREEVETDEGSESDSPSSTDEHPGDLESDDGLEIDDNSSDSALDLSIENVVDNAADAGDYVFFRGDDIYTEMQVWEAARGTSAAPRYFKSFVHSASGYSFDDGALKCNNPVFIADQERKAIWPDLSKQDPDIMLSLGTGFDPSPPTVSIQNSTIPPKRGVRNYFRKLRKIAHEAVLEDMDAELIWRDFIKSIGLNGHDSEGFGRYRRLNPPLSPVPSLDAVDQLETLRKTTMNYVRDHKSTLILTTRMMVATLFYFDLCDVSEVATSSAGSNDSNNPMPVQLICKGRVKSRIQSAELSRRMETQRQLPGGRILFYLDEKHGPDMEALSTEKDLNNSGKISYEVSFTLDKRHKEKDMCIFLDIWGDHRYATCISGFPRLLYSDAKAFHERCSTRHEANRSPAQIGRQRGRSIHGRH